MCIPFLVSSSIVGCLLVTSAVGTPDKQVSHGATHIRLLVRAFVPKALRLAKPVPTRPGEWMFPGPVARYACFATDDRGFSAAPEASSRLVTDVAIASGKGTLRVEAARPGASVHAAGVITQMDCRTGKVITRGPGIVVGGDSTSSKRIPAPAVSASSDSGSISVSIEAALLNPFVPSRTGPAIAYSLKFRYDQATKQLSVVGKTSRFPAYESYVQFNDGDIKPLFLISPTIQSPLRMHDIGMRLGPKPVRSAMIVRTP